MPAQGDDSRKFGLYLALGQAGLEMVAPLGLGVLLDRLLGWTPWLTVCGAIGGFVGGLAHMIFLAQRLNEKDAGDPSRSVEDRSDRRPT